jgi:hypothetical protein
MGRPLGTFALVTAASTAAIEGFARDVPLLVVAFDAVFAGVFLLAVDSILSQLLRKRGSGETSYGCRHGRFLGTLSRARGPSVPFYVRRSVDYGRLPVSRLLRGPLLHTPQGLVVVAWTGAYLLAALVAYLVGWSPWQGKFQSGFIALCFAWPVIVFVMFIRDNHPEFKRSWGRATWLVIYGALPMLFRAYDAWRT